MWQALRSELHPQGLEVVAVALDVDPEAARPWIEQSGAEYPCLVDRAHVVDELFGIVNVPNSVWIDEEGVIVRPAEPAHVAPADERLRRFDRMETDDPAVAPLLKRAREIRVEPDRYVPMLRDWVVRGSESRYALPADEVVRRSDPRSAEHALAACHFELGEALHERGELEAAQRHWRQAHRLHPENWTYKRQAWVLVSPTQGRTEVYDSSWIDDIEAIGAENYYPPLRD